MRKWMKHSWEAMQLKSAHWLTAAVSAKEVPVLILFWLRAEPENLSERCSHTGRQQAAAAQLGLWPCSCLSDPTLVGSFLVPGICSSHHCHRGQWIFSSTSVSWDFLWIWNAVCDYRSISPQLKSQWQNTASRNIINLLLPSEKLKVNSHCITYMNWIKSNYSNFF